MDSTSSSSPFYAPSNAQSRTAWRWHIFGCHFLIPNEFCKGINALSFLARNHPRSSFRLSSYPQWLKTSLCLLKTVCCGRRGPLVPPTGLELVTRTPSFTLASLLLHAATPHPHLPICQRSHLHLHQPAHLPFLCLLTNPLHLRLLVDLPHPCLLPNLPCLHLLITPLCLCLLISPPCLRLPCLCLITYLPCTCQLTRLLAMASSFLGSLNCLTPLL